MFFRDHPENAILAGIGSAGRRYGLVESLRSDHPDREACLQSCPRPQVRSRHAGQALRNAEKPNLFLKSGSPGLIPTA